MTDLVKLFDEFDAYIYENRYSKHEFLQLLQTGKVNKENVKNWSIYKYFQVFQQNCNFSAIHSVAVHQEDIRQYQMQQLLAEETGIQDGTDSHYALMRRFAAAMGATEKELVDVKPSQEIMDFFYFQYNHCKADPIYGMLSIYLVESQTSTSAHKMYTAFKKMYDLSDHDLEWFIVHSTAEDDHADQAKTLITKYALIYPDFYKKGWHIIKEGVEKWTKLQDFYAQVLQGDISLKV